MKKNIIIFILMSFLLSSCFTPFYLKEEGTLNDTKYILKKLPQEKNDLLRFIDSIYYNKMSVSEFTDQDFFGINTMGGYKFPDDKNMASDDIYLKTYNSTYQIINEQYKKYQNDLKLCFYMYQEEYSMNNNELTGTFIDLFYKIENQRYLIIKMYSDIKDSSADYYLNNVFVDSTTSFCYIWKLRLKYGFEF